MMKNKILYISLIIAFVGILITVTGMVWGGENRHLFKNLHPYFGFTFILLIFIHLWMHRNVLKIILHKKQINNGENK